MVRRVLHQIVQRFSRVSSVNTKSPKFIEAVSLFPVCRQGPSVIYNVALSLLHIVYAHKELAVFTLSIWSAADQRRADALGQSVVAWVGEIVTGVSFTRWVGFCNGIIGCDPHGRGVGDSWHGGLFSLLLLSIDDEEQEEEDDQQNQDDNPSNGSDLIGVHMHRSTGETVEVTHHHASLITAHSFPAWVAVTRPRHVVTGGVIQTVTYLTTAIAIRPRRTFLLAVSSHKSCATSALSRYVVTVSSIPALTRLRAVFSVETQWTSLSAVKTRPPWCALALSVVRTAVGSVVTVACVNAVGAPLSWRTRLRTVTSDPSRVTLT